MSFKTLLRSDSKEDPGIQAGCMAVGVYYSRMFRGVMHEPGETAPIFFADGYIYDTDASEEQVHSAPGISRD